MIHDFRAAIRSLIQRPGFALSVILTLGLGIGASTMMFSLVDSALLRPLPFEQSNRLAMLFGVAGPQRAIRGGSFPEVQDWRAMNRTFADVAIYNEMSLNLRLGTEAIRVESEMVSAGYFSLLGARAALGRTFSDDEDRVPDARPVAIISDKLWRERFGAAADILQRPIVLNDRTCTIVGVMPAGFAGLSFDTDLWVPSMMASLTSTPSVMKNRGERWLWALGRLRDGVSLAQAQDDMTRVAAELERQYPDSNRQRGVQIVPLKDALLGSTARLIVTLFTAVLLFLVVSCANVASLQLARTTARRRELAGCRVGYCRRACSGSRRSPASPRRAQRRSACAGVHLSHHVHCGGTRRDTSGRDVTRARSVLGDPHGWPRIFRRSRQPASSLHATTAHRRRNGARHDAVDGRRLDGPEPAASARRTGWIQPRWSDGRPGDAAAIALPRGTARGIRVAPRRGIAATAARR
jgi:hypothetical protein